jgi:hypothetical protein
LRVHGQLQGEDVLELGSSGGGSRDEEGMSDDGRRETALRFGRGANRGSTVGNRRHRRRVDDHERLQLSVPCWKWTRNDLDRKQCAGTVDGPGAALDLEGRVATESLERLARGDGADGWRRSSEDGAGRNRRCRRLDDGGSYWHGDRLGSDACRRRPAWNDPMGLLRDGSSRLATARQQQGDCNATYCERDEDLAARHWCPRDYSDRESPRRVVSTYLMWSQILLYSIGRDCHRH